MQQQGYCMFLIINDIEKFDLIMKNLFDMGIGATSIDSMGMGKLLLENNIKIPFFGSIGQMLEGNRPYNKTVISNIADRQTLDRATKRVLEILEIEKRTGNGFMFVVPVIEAYGFHH